MQQNQGQFTRQRQEPWQFRRFGWVLLIMIASLGCIYFYMIPLLSSTSGGTGSDGFDAHAEALQLALQVQDFRKIHRTIGRNLGMGEIVLEARDGTLTRYPSPIYEGEKAPAAYDPNANHSERRTHDQFLLPELGRMQNNGTLDKVQYIYILIFSQIYVCPPCKADMRGWWKAYKSAVSSQDAGKIQVPAIWELTGSYNPDRPGWPQWTVVANEDDVQQVNITFDR